MEALPHSGGPSASEHPRSIDFRSSDPAPMFNAVTSILMALSVLEHSHTAVDSGSLVCCRTVSALREPLLYLSHELTFV